MRLTIGQKADRVLKLLIGLRNPRIASALTQHGFSEEDLREGWDRLQALTRQRLGVRIPVRDPRLIEALDGFENTWFPVTRFTLERHFPVVAEHLFLNLTQTEGLEVAVSVATFVERLTEMEAGSGVYGADGPVARELLVKRGLTEEIVAEAKTVVEKLGSFREEPKPVPSPEEQQRVEDELWSWYLEWGGIARVAVRDRRLLRQLGFLKPRRSKETETDDNNGTAEPANANNEASSPAPAAPVALPVDAP